MSTLLAPPILICLLVGVALGFATQSIGVGISTGVGLWIALRLMVKRPVADRMRDEAERRARESADAE